MRLAAPLRWTAVWALLAAVAGALLVRLDIAQRRDAFQAEARLAHRLLGQRAAQHDAVLATLVLLARSDDTGQPQQRLPAIYPQVLQVLRRGPGEAWPEPGLDAAEAASRAARAPAAGPVAADGRHYSLVLAGTPASFALRIEVHRWVPWDNRPFGQGSPVRAELRWPDGALVLQPGLPTTWLRRGVTPGFVFEKALDTPSQPFVLHLQRATGPADWPWERLMAVAALLGAGVLLAALLQRQRATARRAEALLRLARTTRLNALGELAAGLAHELNQPLTAVLASTQAARRLLDDDPLPRATLDEALDQASSQARRAADVVARLRRRLERPDSAATLRALSLRESADAVLELLRPELQHQGVAVHVDGSAPPVRADPVALQQILHNLLVNALQAMQGVPAGERTLQLRLAPDQGQGVLTLQDSGPGLAPMVLARLFEPFVTTKTDGLGLGLSLCHTLAAEMGGSLAAQNRPARGACFTLRLPLVAQANADNTEDATPRPAAPMP